MGKRRERFSVLMSIYGKESPVFFSEAMQSTVDQSVEPTEIVLVKDGPLPDELQQAVAQWQGYLGQQLQVVNLGWNRGLGEALRIGLEKCRNEIVARMDTDDICRKDRFEKQVAFLQDHREIDLVGGWIAEFRTNIDEIEGIRMVEELPDNIRKDCAHRSPVNHVSVMFRKESVLRAGGYQTFDGIEDYHLWARMLAQGSKLYNMQEVLVYVRIGPGLRRCRGGVRYLINEWKLQRMLFNMALVSRSQLTTNMLVRIIIRLVPNRTRDLIYHWALRHKGEFIGKASMKSGECREGVHRKQ